MTDRSQKRSLHLSLWVLAIVSIILGILFVLGGWKWAIFVLPIEIAVVLTAFYFRTTDISGRKNDWAIEAAMWSWAFFVIVIVIVIMKCLVR